MSVSTRRFQRAHRTNQPQPPDPGEQFSTAVGRPLVTPLYGVTTEYVTPLSDLSGSLTKHTKRPTVRIVFQADTGASDYTSAISTLRSSSYIYGQLYDSTALKNASVSDCQARTRQFLSEFGESIDLYEIGNELNGNWVGSSQSEIDAKVSAIYNVIKDEYSTLNIRTAITLNYWPTADYYSLPWEATVTYANNMPATLRNGVDYIMLSFYETAGDPIYYPTDQDFTDIFTTLAGLFPKARLAVGEIGAQGVVDGLPSDPTLTEKQRIANRYYGMYAIVKKLLGTYGSRYDGGCFWWYYHQDCVPYNKNDSLWPTLESNFNSY